MLIMYTRFMVASVLCALAVANDAGAQDGRRRPPFPRERDAMHQRFQERFAEVVRDRVGLEPEQMSKLMELNRRFEARRRGILGRERDIRLAMRDALADGVTPNDDLVRKLLDDELRVQRERLELMEAEQGELAQFMTPTQRARYFGIQEQMRRKVEELRGPPGGMVAPPSAGDRPRRRPTRMPRDTTLR
jgi:hypothetical protein